MVSAETELPSGRNLFGGARRHVTSGGCILRGDAGAVESMQRGSLSAQRHEQKISILLAGGGDIGDETETRRVCVIKHDLHHKETQKETCLQRRHIQHEET